MAPRPYNFVASGSLVAAYEEAFPNKIVAMLKSLELTGFKSFATKTRFDFHRGITAIVGPNGSGKSNLVDAVKWVMGEQSVKSLRGKEMVDVIFNGSGTRKAVQSAEVTLTFDNSAGIFQIEASEIQITRRVYRGGESEYLINRQPCRLRDIRELLGQSAVGTQAYAIIEQGKVDSLLQSSAKDRRIIFEEAAGIGRFRAKKLEATRRLERVEQNLLRLSDIVDEVEHRLRGVKAQAGKAQRYREYMSRLQELRTQVGLGDYRRLGEKWSTIDTEIGELTRERDAEAEQTRRLENQLEQIEARVGEVDQTVRKIESRVAGVGESIAANRSTITHERVRCADLETEIAQHRRHLAAMNVRVGDLQQEMRETTDALAEAQSKHHEVAARFEEGEQRLRGLTEQLDDLRARNQSRRGALMEQMRIVASLGDEITTLESQAAVAEADAARLRARLVEYDQELARYDASSRSLDEKHRELVRAEEEQRQHVATAKQRLREQHEEWTRLQEQLSKLQQRQSGLHERADVLRQLQQRHEGLSPGVKEILIQARSDPKGPLGKVQGVVADLLRVSVESAPLIEIALGDKAQHLVLEPDPRAIQHIEANCARLPGRVGFVWLDRSATDPHVARTIALEGRPGVLGRADRFIETDPFYASLARRLLGRTWIVERLSDALTLAREGNGVTAFVTVSGEYLAPDGTLVVGPQHAASGLISRRSELRAIDQQLESLAERVEETRSRIDRLEQHQAATQQQIEQAAESHRLAVRAVDQHEHKVTGAQEKRQQIVENRERVQSELDDAITRNDQMRLASTEAKQRRAAAEQEIASFEKGLQTLAAQIAEAETQRQTHARHTTDIKIELAKSEERLEYLQSRMQQFHDNRQERQKAIDERRRRLAECSEKFSVSERSILNAESAMALLYLEREQEMAEAQRMLEGREDVAGRRSELRTAIRELHARTQKTEARIHKRQLSAGEITHQREALAARLREEYGIELAELQEDRAETLDAEAQQERDEVQKEIDDLRRRINNLGNVNLDAVEELEDLEVRYTTLADQYKDLVDAKTSLEKIIEKINVDSRRLYLDMFEQIKSHFEKLFRDLFGGGQADLVLEEDVDVLESGVEIIARPPGKEPRNISLLSGGEKTLTCVALLLAIFRNRPSPFCVLDEVDAALDEANIGRFMNVLSEFLELTQFVVVTHSKKTMAEADTIYGVTMEESGVSKQVSVRFEDVSDDGEINPTDPASLDDAA